MWRGFRLSLVLKLENTLHALFFFHFTLSCLCLPSSIISALKYKHSFSSVNSTHLPAVQSLVYFSCSSLSFMFPASSFCFIFPRCRHTQDQNTNNWKIQRKKKRKANNQKNKPTLSGTKRVLVRCLGTSCCQNSFGVPWHWFLKFWNINLTNDIPLFGVLMMWWRVLSKARAQKSPTGVKPNWKLVT